MAQWEYRKVDFGFLPRKVTDVDVLNELGKASWELVHIAPNNIAYFKRHLAAQGPGQPTRGARVAAAKGG
jgi:hypothetical protein